MSKKFNTAVLIGRFQPVHSAHIALLKKAEELANQIVVVVGSSFQPRTYKNPFTQDERAQMLSQACVNFEVPVHIEYNHDTIYNDQAWAIRVQSLVAKHEPTSNVVLIGHRKDASSFYLDMFPQWDMHSVPLINPLNATSVRDLYFRENGNIDFLSGVVPTQVFNYLCDFAYTDAFQQIVKERKFIETYKQQFATLPYPPVFVTTDAVVICSGHVLMIRRRAEPGKGLWALPGGFLDVDTDRSLQECAIRELKEETGIKVPAPVLHGSITDSKVFDAIDRSARGRTITHAYKLVLKDGELPKVKGADDADKARWVPIAELASDECFEDHYEIIQWAIGASQ